VVGSVVLDTAVGLVFVFLVVSVSATGLVEYLSKLLDKRGEYLLRGLREMLDVPPSAPSAPGGTTAQAVVDAGSARAHEDAGLLGTRVHRGGGDTRAALQTLSRQGQQLGQALLHRPADEVVLPAALADLVLAHPVVAALHRPVKPGVLPTQDRPGAAPPGTADGAGTDLPSPLRHPVRYVTAVRAAGRRRMRLASYLSSRTFTVALLDLLVPDDRGQTTLDQVVASLTRLPEGLPGRDALLAQARQADGSLTAFRTGVEHWYDEQMGRVSGWYKRWAQWRLFLAGLVLAALFNVDSIAVTQSLYRDESVRQAVVTAALVAEQCPADAGPAREACLGEQTRVLRSMPLPVGWEGTSPAHVLWRAGPAAVLLTLLGWLITAAAVSLGAPFWFDALSRWGSLRTAGTRPEQSRRTG